MPFQTVNRIVRSADKCYFGFFNQSAYGHIRIVCEFLITIVPDFLCSFRCQRFFISEELSEFEIAPVIHRISYGHLECVYEFKKSLVVRFVTGDVILTYSVGSHYTPLIVVSEVCSVRILSAQPYLCKVAEASVFINLSRGYMTVIINQRQT